jgi:hypothetical protein
VRTVRSSLLLFLGVLVVLACSSKPPKPRIVYMHRKHPKKSADTIPLGPPYINLNDPAVLCAKRFVRAMIDSDQGTIEAMISPKWLGQEEIGIDSFVVSRLDIMEVPPHSSYMITDVENDAVTVLVTTERDFTRYLTVQVSNEDGEYYVVPGGADTPCHSIDPWTWPPDPYFAQRKRLKRTSRPMHAARPAINQDSPMVMCARRFVRAMLNNDRRSAVRMLSPRWLKKNGISMDTLVLGRLNLVDVPPGTPFKVVNVNGHVVSVLTAPDSDHELRLSVKTSYEDGRYFVEPSGADYRSHSIDPWTSPTER